MWRAESFVINRGNRTCKSHPSPPASPPSDLNPQTARSWNSQGPPHPRQEPLKRWTRPMPGPPWFPATLAPPKGIHKGWGVTLRAWAKWGTQVPLRHWASQALDYPQDPCCSGPQLLDHTQAGAALGTLRRGGDSGSPELPLQEPPTPAAAPPHTHLVTERWPARGRVHSHLRPG